MQPTIVGQTQIPARVPPLHWRPAAISGTEAAAPL